MKQKTLIILIIVIFLFNYCYSYKALAGLWETDLIQVLNLDDDGNLSIEQTINLTTTAEQIAVSPNGRFAFSHSASIHAYTIDKNQNVTYIGDPYGSQVGDLTITTDLKYIIFTGWPGGISGYHLYKINNDLSLTSTGSCIPYSDTLSAPQGFQESIINNTIIADNSQHQEIAVFRRNEDVLFDTGVRIDITPYRGNGDLIITSNGRFCYIAGTDPYGIVYCEILTNGDVIYKGVAVENVGGHTTPELTITSDSKYLLMIDSYKDPYKIRTYRIEMDGSLTLVFTIDNMELAQAIDLTPDNKYLVVAWNYTSSTQTISVFRLYSDGTLEKLDKDQTIPGGFSDIRFIPPYVTSADDEIWEMYK